MTLLPHSSHFLKCLNLCLIGIMKKHYKLCRSQLFQRNNRKVQKIERMMKFFYTASFPRVILASRKASGIGLTLQQQQLIYGSCHVCQ